SLEAVAIKRDHCDSGEALTPRHRQAGRDFRNTLGAFITFPQMPSVALRDRASSSATPRASPVAARPHPSPIRRKTLPVLPARRDLLLRVAVDHERDGFVEL